ncbi:hypothetical protein JCM18899A_46650 [Nocardioides sp. AN3]
MKLLVLCLIGLMCGLHAATWGGFKDSPFEGFKPTSFVRSVVVGLASSIAIGIATDLESTESVIVLIGLCYTLERLATEWWKSIVREDDQSTYSIPMRLALRGRPIDRRCSRYAVGVAIIAGLILLCWSTQVVQRTLSPLPLWIVLLVAGVGGWLTAVGGAWKDAPVEGFSGWKFLRSPVVATAWAAVLSRFTGDWVILTVAAAGWSVISIETYKTFLTGGRPPGKFADKPVRHLPHAAREACRATHVSLYGALALTLGIGLRPTDVAAAGGPAIDQLLASAAVTLAASAAAALVLVDASARPAPERARRRELAKLHAGR